MKRNSFVIVLLLVLALLVTGTVLADEPAEGRAGRAELRFLEGMIDHHQMALDMAQDCLANAESEDVLTLCQDIIDAQSAEISTMQGWLLAWYNVDYAPMSMMSMSAGDVGAMGGMMGPMGDADAMGGMMGPMGDADAMGSMMGEMGDMMGHMSAMRDMMHSMMGHMEEMHSMMGGMMGRMDEMQGMMGQMGAMGGMDQSQMGAALAETPEAMETTEPETVHDHETHTDVPVAEATAEPAADPAMTMGMMAGLSRLSGADYEVAWLESMIDHHSDAIHMAERILERAEHDELRTMAEAIISDQTAEIEHMEALLSAYVAE